MNNINVQFWLQFLKFFFPVEKYKSIFLITPLLSPHHLSFPPPHDSFPGGGAPSEHKAAVYLETETRQSTQYLCAGSQQVGSRGLFVCFLYPSLLYFPSFLSVFLLFLFLFPIFFWNWTFFRVISYFPIFHRFFSTSPFHTLSLYFSPFWPEKSKKKNLMNIQFVKRNGRDTRSLETFKLHFSKNIRWELVKLENLGYIGDTDETDNFENLKKKIGFKFLIFFSS